MQYIAVCPNKAFFRCEWVDITELQANASNTALNTMSFEDANLIIASLYGAIAIAFGSRLIVKAIIEHYK